MAGVTNEGFIPRSLVEITNDINSSMVAKFGTGFDTSPESADGQVIGVISNLLATMWQQAEAAYNAYSPSSSFGVGLDKLCELNGVTRISNQPTTVAITFNGSNGTLIPKGYIIKTSDDLEFATIADAVIPEVVTAECTTPGAIYIAANEVNTITDVIAGLSSATNLEPGITGIISEEDPALRARRESLVVNAGTSSIDAIYAAVIRLRLPYIAIIENYENVPVNGIPAHSFLTIVEGGTPEEISKAIYDNKPIGCQAFGDIVTQVYDTRGYPHPIGISRPVPIDIDIAVVIKKLQGASLDSESLAQNALVEYINNLQISDDVVWSKLFNVVLEATPNVSVTSITIKFTASGTMGTADLPITVQQRARTDTSKVVVSGS
jgi:uncharacterized phage protein gp47/JayE